MRTHSLVWFACASVLAALPVLASPTPPENAEHPAEVALVQGNDNWSYVHFPSNLRLYVYDKDTAGKSACTVKGGCAGVWPPLVAPPGAKPVGDWSVMNRDDAPPQWAYKGHPVYLRYHDSPSQPAGDGQDGVWHFLQP